jgi:hypothetical protein
LLKNPCCVGVLLLRRLVATGAEKFAHLCPTNDVAGSSAHPGDGDWTFIYQIFSSINCTGERLTGDDRDFACFAPRRARSINSFATTR